MVPKKFYFGYLYCWQSLHRLGVCPTNEPYTTDESNKQMVYETHPVTCVTVNMTLTHAVSHYIMKLIVSSSAKAQIRALHGTQLTYLTNSWFFVVDKIQSPLQ
jgi:hypothetical protein